MGTLSQIDAVALAMQEGAVASEDIRQTLIALAKVTPQDHAQAQNWRAYGDFGTVQVYLGDRPQDVANG